MNKILVVTCLLACFVSCKKPDHYRLVIRNASITDGSGGESYKGDVAINADTIAAIGDLSKATADAEIDAQGLTLAPGFIDTHSHHDWGMDKARELTSLTSQGVTTMIVGQDGGSHFPLSQFYKEIEDNPIAINIGSYTGHNTLRDSVIEGNFQRFCTEEEIEQMKEMVKLDMEAGSLGLSTGLEYDPGIFSNDAEVLELAKSTAAEGGRYISHMRSEDRYFWKALDEIITIGKEANMPVQISHAKLAMKNLWGHADEMIAKLDSARAAGINITADIYPYAYWQSTMTVLFPARNFKDIKASEFALTELTTPEGVLIGRFSPMPEYVGKTLAEISVERKTKPAQTLLDLIAIVEKEKGDESIIATSMTEDDITAIMKWPYSNICSDGTSTGLHPRGYGSFTKILRHYVRERKVLTLEEAVHKMTQQAAENLHITRRGGIKPGYFADLVLFDPATVADHASAKDAHALSTGINHVWVNGVEVYSDGASKNEYPGKIIRRIN